MERQIHGFPAVVDRDSRILILGSFPSVRSRDRAFFYMHPQNRFWRILTAVYGDDFHAGSVTEKIVLLQRHGIALYDVIESCDIIGSADADIRDVIPADIADLITGTRITRILVNGATAYRLFCRYQPALVAMARRMPSTSAANAAQSLDHLIVTWQKALLE